MLLLFDNDDCNVVYFVVVIITTFVSKVMVSLLAYARKYDCCSFVVVVGYGLLFLYSLI